MKRCSQSAGLVTCLLTLTISPFTGFHFLWERKCILKLSLPVSHAIYVPTSCILPHWCKWMKNRLAQWIMCLYYFLKVKWDGTCVPHDIYSLLFLLYCQNIKIYSLRCSRPLTMRSEAATKNRRKKLRVHAYLHFNKLMPAFLQIYVSPGLLLLWVW